MKTDIIKLGSLLVLLTIVFSGCKKEFQDVKPDQTSGKIKSMSEMNVPSGFNWKTTQNIGLELTVSSRSSLVVKSTTGVIYHKALIQPSDTYKASIAIQVYEKELNIIINGVSHVLQINNNKIIHSF
jgi:hypothetical protein